jgi:hypothetical protein
MSADERLVRAHDLGISAFLGDTIYNFGELVRHWFSPFRQNFDLMPALLAHASDTGCTGRHSA